MKKSLCEIKVDVSSENTDKDLASKHQIPISI